jgi:flagellin-like protein
MWTKRKNKAVSEIVGTVMLLGIAIAMFSLVQLFAFGLLTENQNPPSVRLVASVEDRNITIFHNGGESLPLDTRILCTVDDTSSYSINVSDTMKTGAPDDWRIGEKVEYNPGHGILDNSKVEILVVDVKSNSVIMMTTIQG